MGLSSFSERIITVMRACTALFPHLGMGFVGDLRARVCLVAGSQNNERRVAHKELTTVTAAGTGSPQCFGEEEEMIVSGDRIGWDVAHATG